MAHINAPLSKRENQVWEYILAYFCDYPYAPTRREIADAVGFNNVQRVHNILKTMEKKGWIRFHETGWKHRNIIDPKEYDKRV